jgi:tRNA A-37 threonylcarbamoyl transferase component Bud32
MGESSKAGWAHRLGSIGDRPEDMPALRLQHRLLVFMGLLMACGAAVWSGLSFGFGLILPGTIPIGYIVVTLLNFGWFALSKRFERARAIQILISVLLPFFFQWSVGGFHASGGVMLWALVAVVGSLTFTTSREMLKWLFVYSMLVVISGMIDADVRARFPVLVPDQVRILFYVVNFVMISVIVLWLIFYFLDQLTRANEAIVDLRNEVKEARRLGQYTLVEKIGEGGMGAVYRAKHAMLRRPTAIKLIRPDKADEATILRFEREVQITSTLTHPNTVTIYDYGRTDDGTFYYVMEYLDGVDLSLAVRFGGPMPLGRTVRVLCQVAQALAEAHKKGLIHRDVKPANVILTQGHVSDLVKVVDFGLVKELARPGSDGSPSQTQQGQITGTPQYMSPEAITHPETVDGRSDVYSLGCVGYFLLTASPVFASETTIEVYGHHLHTPPAPLADRARREIPRALEQLIFRCLAKNPSQRPTTDELVASLRALAVEPWARWEESDAATWWLERASQLAENRARQAQSMDETIVAPQMHAAK